MNQESFAADTDTRNLTKIGSFYNLANVNQKLRLSIFLKTNLHD